MPSFAERNGVPLARLAVMVGLGGLLIAIGYLAAEVDVYITAAAVAALVGMLALARRVELGIAAMMVSAVFLRYRLPTGTSSEIVISLLICGGLLAYWAFKMLVVDRRLALKPAPVNAPLLGFTATVFVSLVWSRAFRDVLVHDLGSRFVSIAAAVVMALLPVTLLLVINLIGDLRWLKVMVGLFLVEGAVSLVILLPMDLGIGPASAIRQFLSGNGLVWINTQGLYSTWYLSFALALALFHRRLHWGVKALLLLYIAGWFYWGFWVGIGWLAGWAPAFVSAMVIGLLRSRRLFVLLAILAIVAGVYYWQTQFTTEAEVSGSTRLEAYRVNWRITGKHLLFGTGPAGYASYYMSYFPTEAMASHSNYIDLLAQTGIVGTFFYMWFFGVQLWGSFKLWRSLDRRGGFEETIVVAVLGGTVACLVAMALGDWLLPFAYTQGIVGFDGAMFSWLFMGMPWALRQVLPSAQSPVTDTVGSTT